MAFGPQFWATAGLTALLGVIAFVSFMAYWSLRRMDDVVLRARMYMNRKRLFRGLLSIAIGMITFFVLVLVALVGGRVRCIVRVHRLRLLRLLRSLTTARGEARSHSGGEVMELQVDRVEPGSVEATFEEIFVLAMRKQPQIQHIVVASEQGLVIAFKAKSC